MKETLSQPNKKSSNWCASASGATELQKATSVCDALRRSVLPFHVCTTIATPSDDDAAATTQKA
jgi:hypothetical protein